MCRTDGRPILHRKVIGKPVLETVEEYKTQDAMRWFTEGT